MRIVLLCVVGMLLLTGTGIAIDEDTYVQFAADAIITAHTLKGKPRAMEIWSEEMAKKNLPFDSREWKAYEEGLAGDPALKKRVYERILENVKSRGHAARIVELGGGTTIEILD
jgi:hypothetical protein